MRVALFAVLASLFAGAAVRAAGPDLRFQPAGEGYFTFNTGVLQGKVRLDGKSQAIASVVHLPTGIEIAKTPGLLSYYRILCQDMRYGDAVRDWPTIAKLLPDGALSVFWPPAKNHPLEITAVYRWKNPTTLDLDTVVQPQRDMPRMEVFLSSYFHPDSRASVYVKPARFSKEEPSWLPVEFSPLLDGTYVMFPRDREAALMIFDRRWEFPPNPVQWSVTRWLAAPLAVRRHEASGVAAVLMAPAEDCFAVAVPYNKVPPDIIAAHTSLYLSLVGRDLRAGESARARCRLVLDRGLSDQQVVELYKKYLEELAR